MDVAPHCWPFRSSRTDCARLLACSWGTFFCRVSPPFGVGQHRVNILVSDFFAICRVDLLAISAFLVVRVVWLDTNYPKNAFSFVAAAAMLLKYPSRATRPIGVLPSGSPPGGTGAGSGVALCAAPNWYFLRCIPFLSQLFLLLRDSWFFAFTMCTGWRLVSPNPCWHGVILCAEHGVRPDDDECRVSDGVVCPFILGLGVFKVIDVFWDSLAI